MRASNVDLFFIFRFMLVTVCGVYAMIQTACTLWRWHVYLSARWRERVLLRQYLIVHLLRLRPTRFALELVQIFVLSGLLIYLVRLHGTWPRG